MLEKNDRCFSNTPFICSLSLSKLRLDLFLTIIMRNAHHFWIIVIVIKHRIDIRAFNWCELRVNDQSTPLSFKTVFVKFTVICTSDNYEVAVTNDNPMAKSSLI